MKSQQNHFTILDTETEGEAKLRDHIADLYGKLNSCLDAIAGLTIVLEERYGLDVVSSDEDFGRGPLGESNKGEQK